MASTAFDFVSRELEEQTSLTGVEARGTVRLALKAAGLDAATVSPGEMAVVLTRILPGELKARKVDGGDAACAAIQKGLSGIDTGSAGRTTDDVFRRLGG